VDPIKIITISDFEKHPWFATDLPRYLVGKYSQIDFDRAVSFGITFVKAQKV
jgi:hypothetical protein